MRMNELTQSEREFLDEVNEVNLRYCKDADISLWNVCKGYLTGKIKNDFLDLPEDEIEKVLSSLNGDLQIKKKSVKEHSSMLF